MKKYLVDVYLPAAAKHMDVFLPAGKLVAEVTQMLVTAAESLYGESYRATADAMLLWADSGLPCMRSATVEEAGIRSASRLILI